MQLLDKATAESCLSSSGLQLTAIIFELTYMIHTHTYVHDMHACILCERVCHDDVMYAYTGMRVVSNTLLALRRICPRLMDLDGVRHRWYVPDANTSNDGAIEITIVLSCHSIVA